MSPAPARGSILIVDDQPRNLVAIKAALERLECTLVVAHSGAEALQCVLKEDFAAIVLDVHMPDMDGFETASLIRTREQSRATPIIFLTADDRAGPRIMEAYQLGAVDYIHKPFDPDILRAKIAVFVDLFRKSAALEHRTAELLLVTAELARREGEVRALNTRLEQRVIERTAALEAAVHDLQAVDRMKDEFISVVSHELRTPLTSLRGSLGLLSSGLLTTAPERAQRMLDIASRNADRLIRLVQDIIDVERLESGQVALDIAAYDPIGLLEQAIDTQRPAADAAGVHLSGPVGARLPNVPMDADRILQVLDNLIHNAIRFAPPGTTVSVDAALTGDTLLVRVVDHGCGIAAGKLELIFERFQQVDASDTRARGGTGLGLAICRGIVAQHGGKMWVESEVDRGSTFLFTIPLVHESAPTA
jgi:signal transduction histidine kinase